MIAIAAVDQNWGIGLKDQLLVRIPSDMKKFRQHTLNHVVVLGRKTLAGFPNGMPLAQRTNIILSRKKDFTVRGGVVVHDQEELFRELAKYDSDEIYVIGGGSIYNMLIPYCDRAIITKIDYTYEADTFFPNLEKLPTWELAEEGEEETCFSIEYRYQTYVNREPLPFPESGDNS
ncbi:MAG: dihydrofolate reductase [Eubacterium sp.]|nr:dihydrofolate reductase [Eubacterium sp.]